LVQSVRNEWSRSSAIPLFRFKASADVPRTTKWHLCF
jgi:hypothetical protein